MERDGDNLLAEGVYSVGSEIQDGYPEFTMQMLMDLGWDGDLTGEERAAIDAVAGPKTNWKTDLSGGIQRVAIKHECAPFGNAKARAVVWTFRIQCLCIANRSIQIGVIWWQITQPMRIGNSIACLRCMHQFKSRIFQRIIRLFSLWTFGRI